MSVRFSDLPTEILFHLFGYLETEDLAKLSYTCEDLYHMTNAYLSSGRYPTELLDKISEYKISTAKKICDIKIIQNTQYDIEVAEDNINRNMEITSIDIFSKSIENITYTLAYFANVKRLILIKCGLKCIPSSIFKMKKLKYLSLYHNEISSIPDEISKLRLEYLSLCENNLSDVSPLWNVKTLQHLILHKNKISHVSENINNLSELVVLNMSKNNISIFPEIDNLQNVQKIVLYGNPLKYFPHICLLKRLKLISIDHIEESWGNCVRSRVYNLKNTRRKLFH